MLFAISLQNRRHVFRVVFQTEGEKLRACLKTAKKKKPARSLASWLFTRITEDLKSKRPKKNSSYYSERDSNPGHTLRILTFTFTSRV